jgi:hypothetical protein
MMRRVFPTFNTCGPNGSRMGSHVCLHLHQTILPATADRESLAAGHTPVHRPNKEEGDPHAETPAEDNTQERMAGVGRTYWPVAPVQGGDHRPPAQPTWVRGPHGDFPSVINGNSRPWGGGR